MFIIKKIWNIARIPLGVALLVIALTTFCIPFANKEPANLNEYYESLVKKCPSSIQDELIKLKNDHDILALAATLKDRYQEGGRNGLEKLARAVNQNDDLRLRLADIAVKRLNDDNERQEEFFRVHYATLETLEPSVLLPDDPDLANKKAELRNKYLETLENATQSNSWDRAQINPVYVMLLMEVQDEELLTYYEQEKNWLDNVISVVVAGNLDIVVSNAVQIKEEHENLTISDILTVAKENHPYFRDALKTRLEGFDNVQPEDSTNNEENPNSFVFGVNSIISLFSNYGRAIEIAAKEGVPLDETLSVLFGNMPYFESKSSEEIAAILIKTKKERPDVWDSCTRYAYILDATENLEPDLANRLCKEYEKYDIGTLLYTQYEDAIPQAARAIDQYGDLAIAVLAQFSDSTHFPKFLKDDELGSRIIPYTVTFGDAGLERLSENKKWLDKYFDEKGNMKDKGWVESLPGGSLCTVAKNWVTGTPNTWGELGWAVLDVADIALVVATLGSSSAATTGAKTGAKTAAKEKAKQLVRDKLAKGISARVVGSATETTVKRPRIFTSLIEGVSRVTRPVLITVRDTKAGRLMLLPIKLGGVTKKILSPVVKVPKAVYRSWSQLKPATKKIIYRSMLAGCLLTQIWVKTIPATKVAINKTADYIGRLPVKITEVAVDAACASLNGCIDELRKAAVGGLVYGKKFISIGLVFLLGGVAILVPWTKRRYVTVEENS